MTASMIAAYPFTQIMQRVMPNCSINMLTERRSKHYACRVDLPNGYSAFIHAEKSNPREFRLVIMRRRVVIKNPHATAKLQRFLTGTEVVGNVLELARLA